MQAATDRLIEATAAYLRDRAVKHMRDELAVRLRLAFRKQQAALLIHLETIKPLFPSNESLREAVTPQDWGGAFDMAALETLQAFSGPLSEYIQLALMAGSRQMLAAGGFDLSFELPFPEAVQYANTRAAELVSQINATTRADVNRLVTQAVDQGQSYTQLAKSLRDKYTQFHTPRPQLHIRDRAEGIAVHEIGDAYEAGNMQTASTLKDAGLVMQKSALTVGDSRVDPECQANQDQGLDTDRRTISGRQRPRTISRFLSLFNFV